MTYEKANLKIVAKLDQETIIGVGYITKSGKTCYVFQDDITVDTFRRMLDGRWRCLGTSEEKWKLMFFPLLQKNL